MSDEPSDNVQRRATLRHQELIEKGLDPTKMPDKELLEHYQIGPGTIKELRRITDDSDITRCPHCGGVLSIGDSPQDKEGTRDQL